jgi:gliding motility-associated-like protein
VKPRSYASISQTICAGQTYLGHTVTGVYNDTLVAANGCDSVRTLTLTVKPRSYASISQTICAGQTYLGHNVTGVYNDTLVAANGCDSVRTLTLTVKPRSYASISQTICPGQTYLGHTAAGVYNDTLVAANGCDSVRTLNLSLTAYPDPKLGPDEELCVGDTLILSPGVFNTYLWQDGSVLDHLAVSRPGTYKVTVTNNCGSASDAIIISGSQCNIYFPNSFTPNKDGKNDIFNILNAHNFQDYYLAVYNRWGQKVFESNNFLIGWDGTYKGLLANPDVYVWYCQFTTSNITRKMKGNVILIR